MTQELLKAVAHPTNQGILNLLAVEPSYPRKVADLLELPETEVARRLKAMEGLGLVASAWSYIGKNVKLYHLAADRLEMRFTSEGMRVQLSPRSGAATTTLLNPFETVLPTTPEFQGRQAELDALAGPEPVVVVEGMPGIGKTSLLAAMARRAAGQAVFWHEFRGVESLNWLTNRAGVFLAQHGRPALLEAVQRNAEPADRRALLLRDLDVEGTLVVLDDVHRIEDAAVRTLVVDAASTFQKAKLILAAREPLRGVVGAKRVRRVELGGLDDEAVARFVASKGFEVPKKLLPLLRDEVGGHPLALNLLVETAKETKVPLEQLLDRAPEKNLEQWLLGEIHEALGEDELRLLTLASVFRTTFDLDDLHALSEKSLESALVKVRRRLLVQAHETRFSLHEVIHNYFHQHLQDKARYHAKAAAHYLSKRTLEGRLEAMHHYLAAGRRDTVLQLLEENLDLKDFDFIDGGYHNLYLSILDLFGRKDVTDVRRWGLIEDERGDIWFHRGDYEKALTHYAEAERALAKDAPRLADLAWKTGLALSRLDREGDAIRVVDVALKQKELDGTVRNRLEELRTTLAQPRRKVKAGKG